MQLDIITIAIILGISLFVGMGVYLIILSIKKKEYDSKNQKIILDDIRNSFEKQMYVINERLVQSEERWKDVNHLLLRDDYLENQLKLNTGKQIYYSDFLRANGISENDLIIDKKLIFILTPFNDLFFEDYKVIKDICFKNGFNAFRGDEIFIKGDIFPEMLKLIVKSNLIIANINGRNSNVLYELGIAQALDKPVILISKKPEDLPIDVKSKRFLIYNNYNELEEMIRKELLNLS